MDSLGKWLSRKNVLQKELAERVGVKPSAVSKWVREGLPDHRISDVADALDIDDDDLTPDRSGEHVESDEALVDWHAQVSASADDPMTGAMIGSFASFLDKRKWVSVFRTEDFLGETGWPADEVEDRWDDIAGSPFVERVGDYDVRWVFALKFPEEE